MNEVPPARVVKDLAVAYWASRCLHLIAELGIADHLGHVPETAAALARACGVQPQPLNRRYCMIGPMMKPWPYSPI
jgi:hypothetical protein